MKKIVFGCGTEYHILVSYILTLSIYRNNHTILLIHLNPRTAQYKEKILQLRIWSEVFFVNSEDNLESYMKFFNGIGKANFLYHYFSWGFPELNQLYKYCVTKEVPVILTDEGLLSYSPMRRFAGWLSQNPDSVSLIEGIDLRKSQEVWLFEPQLFSETKQWIIKKISLESFIEKLRNDPQIFENFCNLFDLPKDIAFKGEIIYFRQYFNLLGTLPPEVDAWLDHKIVSCFKNEELLIKNHPAEVNSLYQKTGGGFPGENVPWEVLVILSQIVPKKIELPNLYISLTSSAMFKTAILGVKGIFIFLYKIMDKYSTWQDDTLDELILKLKHQFIDSEFLIPSSWGELKENLERISQERHLTFTVNSLPLPEQEIEQYREFYLLNWKNVGILQSQVSNQKNKIALLQNANQEYESAKISLENQLIEQEQKEEKYLVQLAEIEQQAIEYQAKLVEREQKEEKYQAQLVELKKQVATNKAHLEEREQQAAVYQTQVQESEKSLKLIRDEKLSISQKFYDLQTHLNRREQILQDLNSKLLEIYSSSAWNLIKKMWQLRLWLAPRGSRREHVIRSLFGSIKNRFALSKTEATLSTEKIPNHINSETQTTIDKNQINMRTGPKSYQKPITQDGYINLREPWRKQAIENYFLWAKNKFSKYTPITHIISLPLFSTGGAELVAVNFIKAIILENQNAGILVFITDKNLMDHSYEVPENAVFLNVEEFLDTKDRWVKKLFLYDLIQTIKPSIVHNINSSIMWELMIDKGNEIRDYSNLFANIFCFQFNEDGSRTGYAEYYLRNALPHLDGLISDNKKFINDAIVTYGLQNNLEKFHTIYTPSHGITDEDLLFVRNRLKNFNEKVEQESKLSCIWAGRLDAQKKWDMFLSLVKKSFDNEFYMYGNSVIDEKPVIPKLSNLYFCGSFESSKDLFLNNNYDVFIFTSKWEGLPTILIDAGLYGVPIIAPAVGGVGELVTEKTGYLLSENATVDEYMNTLAIIKKNPQEAAKRANNMIDLILERHDWLTFNKNIIDLECYLDKREIRNE